MIVNATTSDLKVGVPGMFLRAPLAKPGKLQVSVEMLSRTLNF